MTEIDCIYAALKEELLSDKDWVTGRTIGRKTFTLGHKPISKTIQLGTGTDIKVQFWKCEDSNLKLELTSDEHHKPTREDLARRLRDFISSTRTLPPGVEESTGSTVINLDHATLAADLKGASVQYFRFVAGALKEWEKAALPALLLARADQSESHHPFWPTALRMARTAQATAAYANGQEVSQRMKEKNFGFRDEIELAALLVELLKQQGGRCTLTGVHIVEDGADIDPEVSASLDRIDSDGHYERGNLQVVCRFANRWKSDGDDRQFRRLLQLVRETAPD